MLVIWKIIYYQGLEIILMHGDKDEIVPVSSLLEAKEFFTQAVIIIKFNQKFSKNCEHRIPQEGLSLGLDFIKKIYINFAINLHQIIT